MKAIALAALALGLLTRAGETQADDAKAAEDGFQGTWTFARFERGGKDLTDTPQFKSADVKIDGNQFRSGAIVATLRLDPFQNPKAIDFQYTKGPFAGQTVKAIYKLDGDTLTFARAAKEGDNRPTEFTSTPNNGQILAILRRTKPAPAAGNECRDQH
jgi:uncharacterized protein (TIGR03067 family)